MEVRKRRRECGEQEEKGLERRTRANGRGGQEEEGWDSMAEGWFRWRRIPRHVMARTCQRERCDLDAAGRVHDEYADGSRSGGEAEEET
eukprot:748727-Hanusia_phi.AAC.3